ncbi:hypothetical protein FH972_001618 [Carpinus fangiana]|uniref:Pyrroloquinoline quinone-dependent pyranose dehydrogenase beta-propeller domain-containing protein n=1 Tax=Carpinus fangiana TaxID=176857 RepID=A0A5N6QCC1_9ROSI|nr:hypothetical protein FH972_001618 [Carpinus fangiana]
MSTILAMLLVAQWIAHVDASCAISIPASAPVPVAAPGYASRLVATGLNSPRGIIFDSAGHLLVVDRGVGVKSLTLNDKGGDCVGVATLKLIISDPSLNHGIALDPSGQTLYASSTNDVYSYPYVPNTGVANTANRGHVVTNMTNDDHVTRTLLISRKVPGTLLVSRGSGANIDPIASQKSSGHASLRRFNLLTRGSRTYNYPYDGALVAWGIRNEVGVDEHPVTGGIYGVENSADNIQRDGKDIHDTNPAEKLNFFGYLNGTASRNTGGNFGYPVCFAAWDPSVIPNNQGIKPGVQFTTGTSSTAKDAACRNNYIAPRLVFDAHQAPLDIKFNKAGSQAFVAFHGSYDRAITKGYKVCTVEFNAAKGDPLMPSTTQNACKIIVNNKKTSACNGSGNCFRPVGLAFDKKGRLYFSSDATGSIYIITKSDGSGVQ